MKSIHDLTKDFKNIFKEHESTIVDILKLMPSGTGIPMIVTLAEIAAKEIQDRKNAG